MVCNEPAHSKTKKPLLIIGGLLIAVAVAGLFVNENGPLTATFLIVGAAVILLAYFAPSHLKLSPTGGFEAKFLYASPTPTAIESINKAELDLRNGHIEDVGDVI